MGKNVPSDIEIAQAATLKPIHEVAEKIGLKQSDLRSYGEWIAKIKLSSLHSRSPNAKLVLVTGINPTIAGEGKSTVSVGLAQALTRLGSSPILCLREPSLGPIFGMKGGAAGGGFSQVLPMEEINLHFTGDFHALTSAHSLLSAALDNNLHRQNSIGIDPRRITWKRAVDMNDRALRNIVIGLGGANSGFPREDGFMITAASEIMAIFSLANDLADLETRLANIVLGSKEDGSLVKASALNVYGAMTLLLKDALAPNLVQTLEGGPALVHGGPFANIAHGCSSMIATKAGLCLGDIVITEAGFGSELGAEKFFDIKCQAGNLKPDAAVVVATIRALKLNGGASAKDLRTPNPEAVQKGLPNLEHHIENVQQFGVPALVAINVFQSDTDEEIAHVQELCAKLGVSCSVANVWEKGGEGGEDLARSLQQTLKQEKSSFRPLYSNELSLQEKMNKIATCVYGADGVDWEGSALQDLHRLEDAGYATLPICVAKTQYSLSDDPARLGRPKGFKITVREVRLSAGAGFVVALTGNVMTMPGLSARPAAESMQVLQDGTIKGLF